MVIDFILNRVSWGKDQADINFVGIQCLLDEGVYRAAYPLHDVSNVLQNLIKIYFYFLQNNIIKFFFPFVINIICIV